MRGEVGERLYSAPPEGFIAARDEAVAAAKEAGDLDTAREIGKLRKPTVAAWLVNLVAHERPDLVEELLELGSQLRDAQRELRGDELRELSVRRRSTVAALAKEAARLAGPDRGNLPLQEVEGTFAAALADATVAAAVQQGTLTKSLEYTGFGETPRPQLRLVQGGEDAPRLGTVTPKRSTPTADDREQRAEARRREEERRRAEADHARAVKQARRELMTALQQLSDAETAKSEAERAVAAAEKAITSAEKRVKLAQDALADLS
jgi:hypothetical protein